MAEEIITDEGILNLFGSADIIPLTLFIFFAIFCFLLVFMVLNNRHQSKINKEWSDAINDLSLAININMEKEKSTLEKLEKNNEKLDQLHLEMAKFNAIIRKHTDNGEILAAIQKHLEGGGN
ncbi:MAG: hypothetical protein ACOCRK_06055 [bacterium]